MNRDEAIAAITSHQKDISMLGVLMSLSGLGFGAVGEEIEKGLGLAPGTLAKALLATDWNTGMSAYLSVLQNAIDGHLATVSNEEWSDTIDA